MQLSAVAPAPETRPAPLHGEFEGAVMIVVRIEEMHGSD
jgi:hypothetical protein